MFLFCRLLPCVSKMFIYKEKWYQVRDPQNLNILKGWNLARKSMKRYHTYDMLLHGNVYLLYPLAGIWNICVILIINTMFWLGQKCLMISLSLIAYGIWFSNHFCVWIYAHTYVHIYIYAHIYNSNILVINLILLRRI